MHSFQSLIFRLASHWSAASSLVVLAIGLLFLLQGFRFTRLLTAVSCAGGGLAFGWLGADVLGLPPIFAIGIAAGLGLLSVLRYRTGLAIASAFTFCALTHHLASQLGIRSNTLLIMAGVGLVGGFCLIWVCRRLLPIIVTIVQGAGLVIVAFVGLTSVSAPDLALTFREWATSFPLMTPAFMLMLCVLGYSVQANARQGDIETGGSTGISELELLG